MNKNDLTYEFWLCEFAKRNLWLSYFSPKKGNPKIGTDYNKAYEDLHFANKAMLNAGKLIWRKLFNEEFNKKNYKEIIYLYEKGGESIQQYFKDLRPDELILVEKLDQEIQLIKKTSERYGFLLCDLLLKRKGNIFNSLYLLDLYIALDSEEFTINTEYNETSSLFSDENIFFNLLSPEVFSNEEKILPSLHNQMQYNRDKELVILSLPQITNIDYKFNEFKDEVIMSLATLRHKHLKHTHLATIEHLTMATLTLFFKGVLQKEDKDFIEKIFLACNNNACYSLKSQKCYEQKNCRNSYFSWLNNPECVKKFNKEQCQQSKKIEFRCTCCLAHEIKNFIKNNISDSIPTERLIENERDAKKLAQHAKISSELKSIKPIVQKFRERQIFGRERKEDRIDSIKNKLLSLFLWDSSNIHGVKTSYLDLELFRYGNKVEYDGFYDKSEEWLHKATTTNITYIDQCIKEMKIISKK